MMTRWPSIAALVVTAACSNGIDTGPGITPDAGGGTNPPAATVTYEGKLDAIMPVAFGGQPSTDCLYTQGMEKLKLDLLIRSGVVIGGAMTNHNVEVVTNPTVCQFLPAAPSDSSYSFTGAQTGADATTVTFTGAADNHPRASLVIKLVPSGAQYEAAITLQRTDLPGTTFAWTINTSLVLAAKP